MGVYLCVCTCECVCSCAFPVVCVRVRTMVMLGNPLLSVLVLPSDEQLFLRIRAICLQVFLNMCMYVCMYAVCECVVVMCICMYVKCIHVYLYIWLQFLLSLNNASEILERGLVCEFHLS